MDVYTSNSSSKNTTPSITTGMFEGKEFVIHGYDAPKQQSLIAVILKNGGKVMQKVSDNTSFLITTPAEAKHINKPVIQDAIRFGVPVLSEAFVWQYSFSQQEFPFLPSSNTAANFVQSQENLKSGSNSTVDIQKSDTGQPSKSLSKAPSGDLSYGAFVTLDRADSANSLASFIVNTAAGRPPSLSFSSMNINNVFSPSKTVSPSITVHESLEEDSNDFLEPPSASFKTAPLEIADYDTDSDDESKRDHSVSSTFSSSPSKSPTRKQNIFLPLVPPTGNTMDIDQRLEWQRLLMTYLKGDEVEMERKKRDYADGSQMLAGIRATNDFWMEVTGKARGVPIREQVRVVEMKRESINFILEFIQGYKAEFELDEETLTLHVETILRDFDSCVSLFPSIRAFYVQFQDAFNMTKIDKRVDALQAWFSLKRRLFYLVNHLKDRTNLSSLNDIEENSIQSILHSQTIQKLFSSNMFRDIEITIKNCITAEKEHCAIWTEMALPSHKNSMDSISKFPFTLMEACLEYWLKTAQTLYESHERNALKAVDIPSTRSNHRKKTEKIPLHLMGIFQLLDDFKASLNQAVDLKIRYHSLGPDVYAPADSKSYSRILNKCLEFYLKLLVTHFRLARNGFWYRNQEMLEQEWEYLKNLSRHVQAGDVTIAETMFQLVYRLVQSISVYVASLMKPPVEPIDDVKTAFKIYSKHLEHLRLRSRKILRFSKNVMSELETCTEYKYRDSDIDAFLSHLQDTDHVEIDIGNSHWLILAENDSVSSVNDFLQLKFFSSYNGTPNTSMQTMDFCARYLLIFPIKEKGKWKGKKFTLKDDVPNLKLEVKEDTFLMITKDGYLHNVITNKLMILCSNNPKFRIDSNGEKRSLFDKINQVRSRIHRALVRCLVALIQIIPPIRLYLTSGTPEALAKFQNQADIVDLLENYFSFASSLGVQALPLLPSTHKTFLVRYLIELSIEWITFTCSDCSPLDKKTFRWALMALEFVLWVTRGGNVLLLSEEAFWEIRRKVACCMTLLISGLNAAHEREMEGLNDDDLEELENAIEGVLQMETVCEEKRLDKDVNELDEKRDQYLLSHNRIGKVLDSANPSYQRIVNLLTSSVSNISIRWQQGKYIGGGSFGQVYLGINLDSGDLMAVKEIQFHSASQDKNNQAAITGTTQNNHMLRIKEEMKVLEQLNHPNVVQYYGIEVHREKCLLFMEYCANGSLRSLLESAGRIEEESVVCLYAYELLEGVSYLHLQKVVHRDIKPDNILFDYAGVLKLVDFGAAKIIEQPNAIFEKQKGQVSLTGTPCYMAPEVVLGSSSKGVFGAQDIWSSGCVIVEMITGKRPWAHLDNEWAILYNIGLSNKHPSLPERKPESCESDTPSSKPEMTSKGVDFLEKCFVKASERPTAIELMKHSFFDELKKQLEDYQKATGSSNTYPNPWLGMGSSTAANSTLSSPSASADATLNRFNSYFGTLAASINSMPNSTTMTMNNTKS